MDLINFVTDAAVQVFRYIVKLLIIILSTAIVALDKISSSNEIIQLFMIVFVIVWIYAYRRR